MRNEVGFFSLLDLYVHCRKVFNTSWVNSPGHYANMTNARYTEIGIGLYRNADGWWATHVFR